MSSLLESLENFKINVARRAHSLKSKMGLFEETQDAEFEELRTQFKKIKKLSKEIFAHLGQIVEHLKCTILLCY